MKHKSVNLILLILIAFIWGSAFVAQSVGVDYIGSFTFNSVRSFLGGIVLLPIVFLKQRHSGEKGSRETIPLLLLGGVCCGTLLAAASSLQQIGLVYTSAGKAGFITALYILLVPLIGLFLGKRAGWRVWMGAALAVPGMYFLCVTSKFSVAKGDFFILQCAVFFSIHILVIGYFVSKVDAIALSCIQFFVCGILCAGFMVFFEHPQADAIFAAWKPLVYAGCLSCGVAYTLQAVAQKNTDPAVASLILSLESVFSVLTGWLVLGERLSHREMFGCILVFAAVILSQLPVPGKRREAIS